MVEPLTSVADPLAALLQPLGTSLEPLGTALEPLGGVVAPLATATEPFSTLTAPLASVAAPLSTVVAPLAAVAAPAAPIAAPVTAILAPLTKPIAPIGSLVGLLAGAPTAPVAVPAPTAPAASPLPVAPTGPLILNGADAGLLSAAGAGGSTVIQAASVDFSPAGIDGASLNGGNALATGAGGSGGSLEVGTAAEPIAGAITVAAPISATTGSNGLLTTTGGAGGKVSLVSAETITVRSAIKVSESASGRASRTGGNISLESRKTSGTAIRIEDSGQLLSLLSAAAPAGPGGTIKFSSSGGDIVVNGGTVRADRGTVDIRNQGAGGAVILTNANLQGDVVKVGALGADGRLIVGGGRIDANSAISLYAGGSNGEVRFVDDVSLTGRSTKTIAGATVTIDNGKTVTIGGTRAASVFTDRPNYSGSGGNGSTSGKFGGAGATTKPFGQRPGF